MVKGRDAVIVLGLAVGATVAVLLLTNLLRLGEDFDAAMAGPLAQRTAGSSWLMPSALTPQPTGGAAQDGTSRRRVAAVAPRVASPGRTPIARSALLAQASPLAAPAAGLRRLAVLGETSPPSRRSTRRAAPPAPRRLAPRPIPTTTTPAPPVLVTASKPEPVPGPAAATSAPQELPASPPPVEEQPSADHEDEADNDRGKGKRDHGRGTREQGAKQHGHE